MAKPKYMYNEMSCLRQKKGDRYSIIISGLNHEGFL